MLGARDANKYRESEKRSYEIIESLEARRAECLRNVEKWEKNGLKPPFEKGVRGIRKRF